MSSSLRLPLRPLAAALATAALLGAAIAGPTLAGKPSGGAGAYTVTVSPAGPYVFGEDVYITTNDPVYPNNTGPWINLSCSQNGVVVLTGTHAGFPSGWYYNWPFTLGPTQSWTSGPASCVVTVTHQGKGKVVTDATTSFSVSG